MEQVGLARRDFLKGIAAAALTAGFIGPSEAKAFVDGGRCGQAQNILPQSLQPYPTIKARRGTEQFWNQVKQAFILPDDYIHMNTGTTGSQPLFSLVNLGVYNLYKSMDPRDWESNLNHDFPDLFPVSANPVLGTTGLNVRQTAVATQYGANPDEIVLSYNTTDACNLIFAGIPWNPGDRIITTHWEHPALNGPINWAHDYHKVDVQIVELPSNFPSTMTPTELLNTYFEPLLSITPPKGNKQYVAFSEVFYKNGLRMPVQQLCQMAASFGAYSIVDSAHGWGQLPINCHGYGADFIAGAGHKWLCGGPGTGIFYIRNQGANLSPFAMGNFYAYSNGDIPSTGTATGPNYNIRPWTLGGPSLYVQLRGELNYPALYAMTDSAAFFNSLGVQDIYNRGVMLGKYLKSKIVHKWGVGALWVNPGDPSFETALTSFNPFAGRNDSSQFDAMNDAMNTVLSTLAGEDPKIYLRTTTWHDKVADSSDNRVGFRISTHGVYNNYQQIDYMFDRLVKAVNASGLPQL